MFYLIECFGPRRGKGTTFGPRLTNVCWTLPYDVSILPIGLLMCRFITILKTLSLCICESGCLWFSVTKL